MSRLLQQAMDLLHEYCASRGDDDFVASVEEEIAALEAKAMLPQRRQRTAQRTHTGVTNMEQPQPTSESAGGASDVERRVMPCPFCGSTALLHMPVPTVSCGERLPPDDPRTRWAVLCNGCGASGPAENDGSEVERWNGRNNGEVRGASRLAGEAAPARTLDRSEKFPGVRLTYLLGVTVKEEVDVPKN